jgi:2-polyprenyl-3-methyl-5-hydroxy-6-metoxy-1,4-benzoquinol methylase
MRQTAVAQHALSNPISRWALEDRLKVSLQMIPENAASLLDMGCGEGHFLAMVEKRFPDMKVAGADLSEENIRYAGKILSRTKLIREDASRIRLPRSSFDVVSALELLDHVESDTSLLSEARRLLKAKGTLIVSTPDSSMLLWRFIWGVWTRTLGRKWSEKHLREYDESGLEKLLNREGFSVKRKARALFGCLMVFACEKSS